LYAVRLIQECPPSSERSNCHPKEYIFRGFEAVETTRAPGSGSRAGVAGIRVFVSATLATAAHVWKSAVSKTLPESVRAKSSEPSAEYHTRSTGPVAGEASISSTEELPTFRQSGRGCAAARNTTASTRPMSRIGTRIVPL
jgi:hypothetical protein